MKDVKVKKARLLETLENNRDTHQADFDLAYEGFRVKAIENVETLLDRIKNADHGTPVQLWVDLVPPTNHVEDYDRAIEMCSWEIGDELVLSDREFRELVQDRWSWKEEVSVSNRLYTGSASPSRRDGARR